MKVTRRSFLATTGMAAAAGPLVLGSTDKAAKRRQSLEKGATNTKPLMTGGNFLTTSSMGTLMESARTHKVTSISTTPFMPRVTAWIPCSVR